MRRYEVSDGRSHKYWEITLHGSSFAVRFGRIGSDGQRRTKEFATSEEARQEWERLIAAKLGGGYKLVYADGPDAADGRPEAAQEARNPELEAAIFAEPEGSEPYLVYGDWLQDHNDPRGELIALQHALAQERDPGSFLRYRKAEQALLQRHGPYFYGERFQDHFHQAKIEWRLGFFGSVEISSDGDDGSAEQVVGLLFDVPSARFLQQLRLNLRGGGETGYRGLTDLLASERWPRSLRRLALGDLGATGRREPACRLGELDRLGSALPGLASLQVSAARVSLGALPMPGLRALEVREAGASCVGAVASQVWPRLERLALWFGGESGVGVADMGPILDGTAVPALRHLALRGAGFGDALCRELVASRVLSQLEVLDLSYGSVSEDGAVALLGARDRLSTLRQLELEGNDLPRGLARRLERAWLRPGRSSGEVNAADPEWDPDDGPEGEDDEHRYDGIME
jgi:uncharacterized protein (TIGR02996 family)